MKRTTKVENAPLNVRLPVGTVHVFFLVKLTAAVSTTDTMDE